MTATDAPSFSLASYQREIFWDDRRFLVFVAGRGVGKTTAGLLRLMGMIDRGDLLPGARVLVMAPDYTQLKDGTLKSFDRWFGPEGADMIIHSVNGNAPMRMLHSDIEVLFRSAVNPDQTRSKECQVVLLDEYAQMTDEVLTLTNANLRQFGNDALYQTIITTTPRGKNHLYRRFGKLIEQAEARSNGAEIPDDDPTVGAYHATTLQAYREGVVREGYIEELGYPPGGQMWDQEVLAKFAAWTGLVFRQQWKKTTVHPPFRYIVGGVDVGSVTPSTIILVGIDEPGNYYVFKEFYKPRTDPHVLMAQIGEWHKEFGVNRWVVDDPDMFRTLRNAGMPSQFPNKQKDAAGMMVNFINSLISRGMLHIDEHECPMLVKEMTTYEYKSKTSGDEVTFLDKVLPHQAEHAIDPLRYACRILSAYKARLSYGKAVEFAIG